jgi:hypothetical protein
MIAKEKYSNSLTFQTNLMPMVMMMALYRGPDFGWNG